MGKGVARTEPTLFFPSLELGKIFQGGDDDDDDDGLHRYQILGSPCVTKAVVMPL